VGGEVRGERWRCGVFAIVKKKVPNAMRCGRGEGGGGGGRRGAGCGRLPGGGGGGMQACEKVRGGAGGEGVCAVRSSGKSPWPGCNVTGS